MLVDLISPPLPDRHILLSPGKVVRAARQPRVPSHPGNDVPRGPPLAAATVTGRPACLWRYGLPPACACSIASNSRTSFSAGQSAPGEHGHCSLLRRSVRHQLVNDQLESELQVAAAPLPDDLTRVLPGAAGGFLQRTQLQKGLQRPFACHGYFLIIKG